MGLHCNVILYTISIKLTNWMKENTICTQRKTLFQMKKLKTERFDIDENSWGYDIYETITRILEEVPVDDVEMDVPSILFKVLNNSVCS